MSSEETGAFRAETVAVIGAGTAGRAFALRCARAGFAVVLEDVMPAKLRRAQDEYSELSSSLGSIRFVGTVEDAVADADIAIDFVPDELESKLEIFSLLDRMAPPRTVLLTLTETLSITDLASCTYRADRCVGVRWTSVSGVEVIKSKFLNPFAEALIVDFFRQLGDEPSVIADPNESQLVSLPGKAGPAVSRSGDAPP